MKTPLSLLLLFISFLVFSHDIGIELDMCGMDNNAQLNIVFCIDDSGSVTEAPFKESLVAVSTMLKYIREHNPHGSEAIRVGALLFSDRIEMLVSNTTLSDVTAVETALTSVKYRGGGGTETAEALQAALRVLESYAFSQARKMIVLVTDGKPSNVEAALQAAVGATQKVQGFRSFVNVTPQGIEIICLGFGADVDTNWDILTRMASADRALKFPSAADLRQRVEATFTRQDSQLVIERVKIENNFQIQLGNTVVMRISLRNKGNKVVNARTLLLTILSPRGTVDAVTGDKTRQFFKDVTVEIADMILPGKIVEVVADLVPLTRDPFSFPEFVSVRLVDKAHKATVLRCDVVLGTHIYLQEVLERTCPWEAVNICPFGLVGAGKSTCGNSIIAAISAMVPKDTFIAMSSDHSVTTNLAKHLLRVFPESARGDMTDINVRWFDTIGFEKSLINYDDVSVIEHIVSGLTPEGSEICTLEELSKWKETDEYKQRVKEYNQHRKDKTRWDEACDVVLWVSNYDFTANADQIRIPPNKTQRLQINENIKAINKKIGGQSLLAVTHISDLNLTAQNVNIEKLAKTFGIVRKNTYPLYAYDKSANNKIFALDRRAWILLLALVDQANVNNIARGYKRRPRKEIDECIHKRLQEYGALAEIPVAPVPVMPVMPGLDSNCAALGTCPSVSGFVGVIKNVLTICGGGLRGVIPIEALRILVQQTGKQVWEMFDLIVGTSTGGILAVAFGILKMTPNQVLDLYNEMGKKIFGSKDTFSNALLWWNLVSSGAKHDHKKLEELFQEAILQRLHDRYLKLDHPDARAGSKVLLVAATAQMDPPTTYLLYNYDVPGRFHAAPGTSEIEIWKALRATTAAATYFQPVEFPNGLKLQDGGILHNNPADIAVQELHDQFGLEMKDLNTFVSLGTGRTAFKDSSGSLSGVISQLATLATNSEGTHNALAKRYYGLDIYYRFNPVTPEVDLAETDPTKLSNLAAATASQLQTASHVFEIKQLLSKLPSIHRIK